MTTHHPRCIDHTTCDGMIASRDEIIHRQAGEIQALRAALLKAEAAHSRCVQLLTEEESKRRALQTRLDGEMDRRAAEEMVLRVHEELIPWCEDFAGSEVPYPSVTIAGVYVSLSIAEILVWDSEAGYADEQNHGDDLTSEGAIACYKTILANLSAWRRDAKEMTL